MKKLIRIAFIFLVAVSGLTAQALLRGHLQDDAGQPLIGANVVANPGQHGTLSDADGNWTLNITPGSYTLSITYVGYNTVDLPVTAVEGINQIPVQTLSESAVFLEDVVVVGSRNAPRSLTTTPLPIDVLNNQELIATGQNTFDKTLQYRVPSFNVVQTPVNDATSLLDPYEIRNLGPSRTLILINGKRKNLSSLLNTQTSPARGETGSDISAIPVDAIKRVEILRDGASAQYGSDAIAGVMNIILKDNSEGGNVTLRSGITGKGDGEMIGIALNNGSSLGSKGFVNYTIDFSKINEARRSGTVSAEGEASDFGADLNEVKAYLAKYPDANNHNSAPATTAAKFEMNAGSKLTSHSDIYANAAYVYKKVNSFANFRTPYWRTLSDYPYLKDFFPDGPNGEYIGYQPSFDGDLTDYNGTIGFRNTSNGWNTDVSFTTGGNRQLYLVANSQNRNGTKNPDGTNKYQENSPISFKPGGESFRHVVGNLDITRKFNDMIGIAVGSEFRSENFEIIAGDQASYEDGGADSYAGNDIRNAGKFNRYNFGAYGDVSLDLTKAFLINGTARHENYSDFGGATVWKLSSRYLLWNDRATLRASYSTGFRAPTLHQKFYQKAQYSFVPGSGIQVAGLTNNVSREARLLGLPALNPEKSRNFTAGIGLRPINRMNITLDYYYIDIRDRILLSTEITPTAGGNTPLDKVLMEGNLTSVSFFANALNTYTTGLDLVINYRGTKIGSGDLDINLAGNYAIANDNYQVAEGKYVNNPKLIDEAGQSVINQTQEHLYFTSRPKYKTILGFDYEIGNWLFSLNNTLFGPVQFKQAGMDADLYTEFKPKVVTDLGVGYRFCKRWNVNLNCNNLLDVLPKWEFKAENASGTTKLNDPQFVQTQSNLITFNQRYPVTTYDGSHFSQLGRLFSISINYKL
ncbi:MAG: TonB-dependent receptor [Saprospiraceae bacterium]|nr:TonB-dependent receptor [Saprospiraceae bacterium]HMW38054.1 TonB-dependent receptor [Saprospiraceae bacterium]HMX87016.1 TonB-dependent receptor [Saprospiraceae bacterium]HMZ39805.1 TonB-dependent receptor [Saprospiraceae bacterium]HNC35853.1 TonB-dependent receptor [Saprospiraceae bacterium]